MKIIKLLLSILIFIAALPVQAADEFVVVVQEPYIDLHTGPGRGYPKFYAIARGATLTIIKQRTSWIKVRTENEKLGWVKAADLEKTLSTEGQQVALSNSEFSDYQQQRIEAGVLGGTFASDPLVGVYAGLRLSQAISIEANAAQVTGDFSNSTLVSLSVVAQPASDKRLSPYVRIGYGRLENKPNRNLIAAQDRDSNFYSVGVGVRYYIARSFVARLEYKRYNLLNSENNNDEHNAYGLGLSFFF